MIWIITECAGVICASLTYIIVFTVTIGMIRVGIWEDLIKGEPRAIFHLVVF